MELCYWWSYLRVDLPFLIHLSSFYLLRASTRSLLYGTKVSFTYSCCSPLLASFQWNFVVETEPVVLLIER